MASNNIDSTGGSVVDEVFGGAKEICPDPHVLDQKTADQRAIDILELNNRNYVTGNGATYGNPEILAGKIIKVEGLGEKFSGKYCVVSAKHELVPLQGYRTAFSFISSLGSPAQAGGGEETAAQAGVASSTKEEEEEQEEQAKNPQITNLKWIKDGEEITKANVDDRVLLTAEVQDLDDGTSVEINIWEKDEVGSDDFIKRYSAYVKNGKIEKEWKVEYHEDMDDVESEQEQEEKGYTLPEYVFKIEMINSPDINVRTKNNDTILHHRTVIANIDILDYLIQKGININVNNNLDQSPLYYCIKYANPDILKLLINSKVDINTGTVYNPLYTAVKENKYNLAKQLIEAGANINIIIDDKKNTPVFTAVKNSDKTLLSFLINNDADINIQNAAKQAPIDLCRNIAILKMLIKCGASINKIDQYGNNLLFNILNQGDFDSYYERENLSFLEMVKYLDEKGSNLFFINKIGNNLLHVTRDIETITYLINKGININKQNNNGESPMFKIIMQADSSSYNHERTEVFMQIIKCFLENNVLITDTEKLQLSTINKQKIKNLLQDYRIFETPLNTGSALQN